jgi:hypothetical protein
MAQPRFVDGEGGLQWFSDNGEGSDGCSGPWKSSRGSWFIMSGSVSMRQRADSIGLGFGQFSSKLRIVGVPFYKGLWLGILHTNKTLSPCHGSDREFNSFGFSRDLRLGIILLQFILNSLRFSPLIPTRGTESRVGTLRIEWRGQV